MLIFFFLVADTFSFRFISSFISCKLLVWGFGFGDRQVGVVDRLCQFCTVSIGTNSFKILLPTLNNQPSVKDWSTLFFVRTPGIRGKKQWETQAWGPKRLFLQETKNMKIFFKIGARIIKDKLPRNFWDFSENLRVQPIGWYSTSAVD